MDFFNEFKSIFTRLEHGTITSTVQYNNIEKRIEKKKLASVSRRSKIIASSCLWDDWHRHFMWETHGSERKESLSNPEEPAGVDTAVGEAQWELSTYERAVYLPPLFLISLLVFKVLSSLHLMFTIFMPWSCRYMRTLEECGNKWDEGSAMGRRSAVDEREEETRDVAKEWGHRQPEIKQYETGLTFCFALLITSAWIFELMASVKVCRSTIWVNSSNSVPTSHHW